MRRVLHPHIELSNGVDPYTFSDKKLMSKHDDLWSAQAEWKKVGKLDGTSLLREGQVKLGILANEISTRY